MKFLSWCCKYRCVLRNAILYNDNLLIQHKYATKIHEQFFRFISNPVTPHLLSPTLSICNVHYPSPFRPAMVVGKGCNVSLLILGWQLWLKQWIVILKTSYFLISFIVSSCVLKEFINTNGTSQPYFLFKPCNIEKNTCTVQQILPYFSF